MRDELASLVKKEESFEAIEETVLGANEIEQILRGETLTGIYAAG